MEFNGIKTLDGTDSRLCITSNEIGYALQAAPMTSTGGVFAFAFALSRGSHASECLNQATFAARTTGDRPFCFRSPELSLFDYLRIQTSPAHLRSPTYKTHS